MKKVNLTQPKKRVGFRTPNRFRRNFNRLAPIIKARVTPRLPRTQHRV